MDLSDGDGGAVFKKVLRLDHEGGAIRAYQCLLHTDELAKPEPMEQNCVLLADIQESQIQALIARKNSCAELGGGEIAVIGTLGLLAGMGGSTLASIPLIFIDPPYMGRILGSVLIVSTVATVVGLRYFIKDSCERGVSLITSRFYDEINNRVPTDHTRLLQIDNKAWEVLDAVLPR